jgi:pimeloyl-ACP methyl ester carboxylesterase
VRSWLAAADEFGRRIGWCRARDLAEAGTALLALHDAEARAAFLRTLRSVADVHGQSVTALDRLYLAAALPMLVIWGARDPIMPRRHAEIVRDQLPTARVEVFRDAGHWPHLADPERFCSVLLDFLGSTAPVAHDRDGWRALLRQDLLP